MACDLASLKIIHVFVKRNLAAKLNQSESKWIVTRESWRFEWKILLFLYEIEHFPFKSPDTCGEILHNSTYFPNENQITLEYSWIMRDN